ncbi:MAG: UDP-3-O-(3-hydroxymyristoyl)glucosamine N-acyltransferase [Candidatus Omnitrophica bacterium]|jgi:UDP-3-O-[3-hydroxymyristoyl] glucosamine N-acyltransferase|nr:UDP-3-O-(3-hydroxymyristoyl)glucosamine N-acyltransferase [Candidatus Omnitrophota bacterium]MDD3987502.1 UDP-3-O-(3-hydroxymyristoyl)glucosamine N-acyltransferase [Candidatus Omnitrophota bacterium]MDD4981235.1 UDP-3-O-(3-hydroxymyristoyl)glucosamine N-acyltransferase [Candidatus Omnitrophota bacterium]MDD5664744.1 UDP-3-O-(3-hydroxymyristoyl)glucosamine N-acyltransferase [Candidatus Omnitrophota bacterium]
MRKTLKEIALLIKGEVVGDDNIVITGANGIKESEAGDITFLSNPKYYPLLDSTAASAVITSRDKFETRKAVIRTDNPSLAFAKIISLIKADTTSCLKGIHPSAVLGKNVNLGKNAALGAHVVIEDDVSIGDDVSIYPGVFIGRESKIGEGSLIYPNVTIRERTIIGKKVIIHSGTVVGSDGFGFVTIDDLHHKIPQVGIVEICDDVEIGANVTIDRARFDRTVIGSGTKIDNLVQIAHNVVIGKNCLIVAQVGISGSTVIGDNVVLAGQVGLVGHINIGDGAIVTAQSGVTKSIPPKGMVSGSPARPFAINQKVLACTQSLPKFFVLIKELKKKIEGLESKLP